MACIERSQIGNIDKKIEAQTNLLQNDSAITITSEIETKFHRY